MLKFAIVGFGGLGQKHFNNYAKVKELAASDIELVALCDIRDCFGEKVKTNLGDSGIGADITAFRTYLDLDELLDNEQLDFVITAVPTYLHAEIANRIMERKIHVFSEKPMAISNEEAQSMYDSSVKNGVKLMIGQCCRYDAMYAKLKEVLTGGTYGKVYRANFERLSPAATWGWENWFMDEAKSGGAAIDLHVHDVDFINYAFGKPKSVTSFAAHSMVGYDSIVTRYDYDGMLVTSVGDWGNSTESYPFKEAYMVQFEKATLEGVNGKVMCYPCGGEAYSIDCGDKDGYIWEIVDFIDCIVNDKKSTINPAESSLVTMQIAFAEKESAKLGKTIIL